MTNGKRLVVLLVVTGMLLSGAAVATQTISLDTSATDDTSSQTQIQDETVLHEFNGSDNDSAPAIVQAITHNVSTPVLEVKHNGSDRIIFSNSSGVNITSDGAGASEGSHWNFTVAQSELADAERTIDENVTLSFRVRNNSTSAGVDEVRFDVHLNSTNDTHVTDVDDADLDNDSDIITTFEGDEAGLVGQVVDLSTDGDDESHIDEDNIDVQGDTTDVYFVFSNGTVDDDFDAAIPSSVSDGDRMFRMPLVVDSEELEREKPLVVYHEEPADGVDEDDDTYGVYLSDYGGEPAVKVHLGEEFDDADQIDVRLKGNVARRDALWHRIAVLTGRTGIMWLDPLVEIDDFGLPVPEVGGSGLPVLQGGGLATASIVAGVGVGAAAGRRRMEG